MTVEEMVNMVGVRLQDLQEAVYTRKLKITALNSASLNVFSKLPMHALKPFETEAESVSNGDDVTSFTGNLHGGINAVIYVYVPDLDKYATKVSLDQQAQYVRRGLGDYYVTPRYYFKGTKIYFVPDSKAATVTYYVSPVTIVDEDTDLDPYFDEIFHNAIVDVASAILSGNKELEHFAYREIEELCMQFFGTDTMRFDVKEKSRDGIIADPQWDNV